MDQSAFNNQGFPCALLNSENSPLKALIRYLHDDCGLRFCEISKLVYRKHNTVMTSYASSKGQPGPVISPCIPFSLLSDLTVFEAAVHHLHMLGESCSSIAEFLGKRPSEIHTVLHRSKKKLPAQSVEHAHVVGTPKSIPVAVFSNSLAPLQSLSCFLFYNAKLPVGKIARLTGRSSSTISLTLKHSLGVCSGKSIDNSLGMIPLSLFHDRHLSVGEHVVVYLLKTGKSRKDVANLLNRDYQTITTLANRAAAKVVRK